LIVVFPAFSTSAPAFLPLRLRSSGTFNNYFLASDFNDLWLRINSLLAQFRDENILPAGVVSSEALGRPEYFAIILVFGDELRPACLPVVLDTWHVQITQTDMIFWSVLGLLLAFNSIRPGKPVSPRQKQIYSHKSALTHSLKVLGVFSTMAILWSVWTNGSIEQWQSVFSGCRARYQTRLFFSINFGNCRCGCLGAYVRSMYAEQVPAWSTH
jgi:hypothetical protein